jgi:hypothetical protein
MPTGLDQLSRKLKPAPTIEGGSCLVRAAQRHSREPEALLEPPARQHSVTAYSMRDRQYWASREVLRKRDSMQLLAGERSGTRSQQLAPTSCRSESRRLCSSPEPRPSVPQVADRADANVAWWLPIAGRTPDPASSADVRSSWHPPWLNGAATTAGQGVCRFHRTTPTRTSPAPTTSRLSRRRPRIMEIRRAS